MRTVLCSTLLFAAGSAFGAEADVPRLSKYLSGDSFKVVWLPAAPVDPAARLEIGEGYGHGFTLAWLRFQPARDHVDVLSILLDQGYHPFRSKWQPDRAPVTVTSARMSPKAYAALLADVAAIGEAHLNRRDTLTGSFSSNDFWVAARLTEGEQKPRVDLDWAGYDGTAEEAFAARPKAAVELARAATAKLPFRKHELTAEERAWASERFARDWKAFGTKDFYGWVRERAVITVGVAGDAAALPTLRDIIKSSPDEHDVYAAINAVTRLTGKDVRTKPVEEMDLAAVRPKVLDLLRDGK